MGNTIVLENLDTVTTEMIDRPIGTLIEVHHADFWLNGPREGLQIGNHAIPQLNTHDVKIQNVRVLYKTDHPINEFGLSKLRHLIECNTQPKAVIGICDPQNLPISLKVDILLYEFVNVCRKIRKPVEEVDMLKIACFITKLEAATKSWNEPPPPYSA